MNLPDFSDHPQRRLNPLTGDWVLVSPHRTKRPWQGKHETVADERPHHDPGCYLCPGNERASGGKNPIYENVYVFPNDFAALLPDTPAGSDNPVSFIRRETVQGESRVICFSPRHDLTLPQMSTEGIGRVIELWREQVDDLGKRYRWVQIFENKGAVMGCSNPHPHGQIWASDSMPNEARKEDDKQRQYFAEHSRPLLLDYLKFELEAQERIVAENDDFVVVVPFWATWPFETLLLPKRHVQRLSDLRPTEVSSLAEILKGFLTKYDNLFETSFPYTMGWHGAPTGDDLKSENDHWQLHAHFYPPLLRSATVKKFMVGYEMLAEAQRDITAEQAASRIRACSDVHFSESQAK